MVAGALVLAFGTIQLASESLSARAAVPGTLPARISPNFGEGVYRVLDRVAPAPYVESALAVRALERGDSAAAERYALRLPASSGRDGLLAQVARARGQDQLALEYSLAAFDGDAVQAEADRLAQRDPQAAFALERTLERAMSRRTTHPDALAQARWEMGLLANRTAWRKVPGSPEQRAWLRRAFAGFDAAVAIAPLSERYALADANQADLLGRRARAEQLFRLAAQIDPGSADAIAGIGVVELENGDRQAAAAQLTRARALNSGSPMVRALERDLR
jgi:hypothetical protein